MGTGKTFRIFVSAVSKELGGFRAEVARVLRRKGLVREQEHFRQAAPRCSSRSATTSAAATR